jgi:two-component system chemotaxis sensor kinase CheA
MAPKLGDVLLSQGLLSFDDLQAALKEQSETKDPIGKVLVRRGLVSEAQIEKALSAQTAAREGKNSDTAMRVEVSKLDQLINLVGELVLERNRLLQLSRSCADERAWSEHFADALSQSTARLSLLTEEIQSASLKTRMVPISVVFRRFPRIVRDVARNLGKEVELNIEGENTELDKTVVEEIADPMVHLVRNALDHGIEKPDVRAEKGKPRCGTIQLDARQEGDHIIISIQDDGAGIDPARISAKAIEKGLVTPERVKTMSKTEILEMIFLPGFSTAEKVTDISGRGVGMDVVRSNIKKLNGAVEMDSHIGLGSTITLKLPLTLAILPVLLVKESGNAYGLPLRSVLETLRIDRRDIHLVEGQEVVQLQDRVLPLVRLNRVLNTGTAPENSDLMRVVILSVGERRMAVLVDEFIGQEQTVVKPLGSYLRRVPGLAGASISGDGRVRLVLDPAGIAGLMEQTVTG